MAQHLHAHPLFHPHSELLSPDERIALSYKRARLLFKSYGLTLRDIQYCSPRFWEMFRDPLFAADISMFTVVVVHVNLVLGTLSRHLKHRPDLRPLVDSLMRFETIGIYLLSERGHGLDAFNIETTATKTPNGFLLHTPREEGAKFMPGTSPLYGFPKVALTMARLIVDGEDRGTRFFVVPLCNTREMYQGVESITLPRRSGTHPFDWSITRFNNVRLPPTALISSDPNDLSRPSDPSFAWWNEIWRIPFGTLGIASPWIPALKATAYTGGRYSMVRCILGKGDKPYPIFSFRTQQLPVLRATATAIVMDNWYSSLIDAVMDNTLDPNVRHAYAVIGKTTVIRHFQRCVSEVSERLGAQGTFEHNHLAKLENDAKGAIIAEGDVLTLCIRLFSELLLGRYQIPLPPSSESLLASHASSIFQENLLLFETLKCDHRSPTFNSLLLPQAELVIESMGHALAYSSALKSDIPKYVLDMYECAVISRDSAWYTEQAGLGRMEQRKREDKAVEGMLPHFSELVTSLDVGETLRAPIVEDGLWKRYLERLTVHSGNAVSPLVPEQFHAML
ncbi:hypothetical protein AGABI1DRAFT_108106 [Agaricus bisporus var. burnettii JB137-S8]|uniref:Acyl-CoA oxidase n=1 Tax=Agaricus bisporus var. burnettii (strain JB137-S8 / ATCC MYA-4627 / FGSC 10392) TaxID=597362 RepID=K5XRW3_AGABU|nr:uncharacterized protein AGABI1DRAFT_108106 [Agaricus bisporus var. burnettii JB137-S8]EKM77620.1 hypothetical protein AGABI1DRAFT_108106 [Agaricus bisporus var. burnettii JB137-S8]